MAHISHDYFLDLVSVHHYQAINRVTLPGIFWADSCKFHCLDIVKPHRLCHGLWILAILILWIWWIIEDLVLMTNIRWALRFADPSDWLLGEGRTLSLTTISPCFVKLKHPNSDYIIAFYSSQQGIIAREFLLHVVLLCCTKSTADFTSGSFIESSALQWWREAMTITSGVCHMAPCVYAY